MSASYVVDKALGVGTGLLGGAKNKGGIVKWAAEVVETPVNGVLGSWVGKAVVGAGEGLVKTADRVVDPIVNSNVVKGSANMVKVVHAKATDTSTAVRTKFSDAGALVVSTLDQARPANVKKNAVVLYGSFLTKADKFVDSALPEDETFNATGLVSVAKKATSRSARRVGKAAKAAATAVKNAPGAFKTAVKRGLSAAADQVKKAKKRAIEIAEMRKQARLPTLEDCRPVVVNIQNFLAPVDNIFLKFWVTASIRDMFVTTYKEYVAPRVEKLAAKKALSAPEPVEQLPAAEEASAPSEEFEGLPVEATLPAGN